ncbi:MAG: hypothetical protein Q9162_004453 [Coniocarpon cinnabarinum]
MLPLPETSILNSVPVSLRPLTISNTPQVMCWPGGTLRLGSTSYPAAAVDDRHLRRRGLVDVVDADKPSPPSGAVLATRTSPSPSSPAATTMAASTRLTSLALLLTGAHGAACVYACSHNSNAPSAAEEVAKTHPNTKIIEYPLHVADEQDTLALLDDVLNQWGRLDVWVTSSGLLGPSSITETGPTELLKCFETNSMAAFFALKYAPAAMGKTTSRGSYPNAAPKDEKYGSIIVVSSVASTHGGAFESDS